MRVRFRLLWRPSSRWITWGSATLVSVGSAGVRASRQCTASIGPVTLWLIVPLSRRQHQEEERRVQPALRRMAKRRG